ncbi:hypothetical protein VTO73DRAFT_14412 [Trametes versicolor]
MHHIAGLHTTRNSFALVNRLPQELLATIFSYVCSNADTNVDVISMSHVCTHWRTVALDAGGLWTHIALTDPLGIETFLERSNSLPLRISLTASQSPFKPILNLVSSNITRVRSLKICIATTVDSGFITRRLKLVAPALEELSIEKFQLRSKVERPPPAGTRVDVFDGMPALRTLSLRNVPLLFLPKGPSALTKIDLHLKLPKLPTLLDLLESSPLLESLSLHGTLYGDLVQSQRLVTLPRLTSLSVHTFPPQGIAHLLSSVALPPSASIALHASLDIVNSFADIFPDHPGPPLALAGLDGVLRRLELLWSDGEELTMRAFRGADDFACAPALQVVASHINPVPGPRFLCDWAFDTAHVETLVLHGDWAPGRAHEPDVPREHWAALLAALPALKTMRLMSLGSEVLQNLFMCFALAGRDPCPKLETLEVFDGNPTHIFWGGLTPILNRRRNKCFRTLELFNSGELPWGEEVAQSFKDSGLEIIHDDDDGQLATELA